MKAIARLRRRLTATKERRSPRERDCMTERPPTKEPRDTLLLSHANPEDNEFTLWLALQLANHGYKVWSDLTKLLGGEVFWDKIEDVIRNGAAKVLYVLSRTSNTKDGRFASCILRKASRRRSD